MQLSEAIRLGSMLKPQGTGSASLCSEIVSCALGAALDAISMPVAERRGASGYLRIRQMWPIANVYVTHPMTRNRADVLDVIWSLNDWPHYFTREQIASWVEQIEKEHERVADTSAGSSSIENLENRDVLAVDRASR